MCGVFFFPSFAECALRKKTNTVRGNWDHKSTAQECTIPSASRSRNNPEEEPVPETNTADASRAAPIQWKHRGNSACPAFLSPAARWEGAWLCRSAGFCIQTGAGDALNQTSLWGHCTMRMVKNRSLCSKWMNANCLGSSLLIRLLQCGRRKSYCDNYSSDQQKGLPVGQREANAPFSLDTCYIYVFVNIKTQQTHALPSLLPLLKATWPSQKLLL